MRKSQLLAVFFFSAVWGLSESALGDALYTRQISYASVPLTAVAFFLLAVARPFLPRIGGATAVGLLAMLYKFLNVPFFACHLTAIALLGASWDLLFGFMSRGQRSPAVSVSHLGGFPRPALLRAAAFAAAAVWLSYGLFVLAMVFVFRSPHWVARGLSGAAEHVLVSGSLAAFASALVTPLGLLLGERFRGRASAPAQVGLRLDFASALAGVVAVGLWAYGVVAKMIRS